MMYQCNISWDFAQIERTFTQHIAAEYGIFEVASPLFRGFSAIFSAYNAYIRRITGGHMRRGTIVLILFILLAVGLVAANQFFVSQPPLPITIAVSPLAADWIRSAAETYTRTNPIPRVQITVTSIEDLEVWRTQGESGWTPLNHPQAWIPASVISLGYTANSNLTFSTQAASLAQTPLVWGGYASRVEVVNTAGVLDWTSVAQAAKAGSWSQLPGGQANWQFVKLAFSRPDRSMSGLAALLTGAASFNDSAVVSGAGLRSAELQAWLRPILESIPNVNTLGTDPAQSMATRGTSMGEIALLPESQWLLNLSNLQNTEPFILNYSEYQFVFDFPLLAWSGPDMTADQRNAVNAFSAYLQSAEQQTAAQSFGLRSAQGALQADHPLVTAALDSGLQISPPASQIITAPSLVELQGFIQTLSSILG